jgi:hypothetical protein
VVFVCGGLDALAARTLLYNKRRGSDGRNAARYPIARHAPHIQRKHTVASFPYLFNISGRNPLMIFIDTFSY